MPLSPEDKEFICRALGAHAALTIAGASEDDLNDGFELATRIIRRWAGLTGEAAHSPQKEMPFNGDPDRA